MKYTETKTDFLRRKKINFYKKNVFIWSQNGWKMKQYIALKDYLFFSQLKMPQLIVQLI